MIASTFSFVNFSIVRSDTTSDVALPNNNLVNEFIPLPSSRLKIENLKAEKQAAIIKADRDSKVKRIEAILSKFNSPFTGLGYIIIDKIEECGGGDFRILAAIAGNESGFGRIPYKLYNPFGYLNGVTYSGWEESLAVLTCKITQQYLVPCNSSPECIVVKYAGPADDKQKWIYNIHWFANQI